MAEKSYHMRLMQGKAEEGGGSLLPATHFGQAVPSFRKLQSERHLLQLLHQNIFVNSTPHGCHEEVTKDVDEVALQTTLKLKASPVQSLLAAPA